MEWRSGGVEELTPLGDPVSDEAEAGYFFSSPLLAASILLRLEGMRLRLGTVKP